ncbi:hypothetical protein PG999_012050 [Apiospora kogelbergensis]|uniref:Major Facilitator Superfamily protein n=1 Tax=Apiospora kogelbergensis TaxID=1337665 RepID=A0AAW0QQI2_9PEZI
MLIMQFLTGATTASTFVLCGTLLTDLNIQRSATAQAASNLVRCLTAAGAIAAMEALVQSLGPGWCFAIYAILLMMCVPLAWVLRRQGMAWRRKKVGGVSGPGAGSQGPNEGPETF